MERPKDAEGTGVPVINGPVKRLDLDKLNEPRRANAAPGAAGRDASPHTPLNSAGNSPDGQPGKLRRMISLMKLQFTGGDSNAPTSSGSNRSPVIGRNSGPGIARLPSGESGWVKEGGDRYSRSTTVVGSGSYGAVYRGKHLITGQYVAIKVFQRKGDGSQKDSGIYKHFEAERYALEFIARAPHENVIRLVGYYSVDHSPRIVTEYCEVSLLDVLRADPDGRVLLEPHYKEIMRCVFSAISHCINLGVYNMDVKLENVLFVVNPLITSREVPTLMCVNMDALKTVRIIDWGFSVIEPNNGLRTIALRTDLNIGSEHYLAPEVGSASYEIESAIYWALGVCLYACIERRLPWSLEPNRPESYHLRAAGAYPRIKKQVSESAIYLLNGLLQVQPRERIKARDALTLDWFARGVSARDTDEKTPNVSRSHSEPIAIPQKQRSTRVLARP